MRGGKRAAQMKVGVKGGRVEGKGEVEDWMVGGVGWFVVVWLCGTLGELGGFTGLRVE